MPPKLIALIIKELLSAFRDPRTRVAFIIPPIMQVFLYAYAATLDVTNAPIGVYNEDWGQSSRQLVSRFEQASAFSTITYFKSEKEIQPAIDSQSVLAVVRIPQDFSRKVAAREPVSVQVLLDGRKSNSAQILNGYINSIVANYAADVVLGEERPEVSAVLDRSWFNPNREYRNTMVPGLVGTLTMTTVLMVMVMSVSRERELGTFEQLLVSPLQPTEIMIGKAVPGLHHRRRAGDGDNRDRDAGVRHPANRLDFRALCGPDRVHAGDHWRGAVHLVARLDAAAGHARRDGLHDARHDAVGLHEPRCRTCPTGCNRWRL